MTPSTVAPWPTIFTIVGTAIAAGITLATAANIQLPVITTERAAAIALLIVGFAMCVVGGSGRVIGSVGMGHPVAIIGSIVGILALILGASVVFSFKLPLIASDRVAVFLLAGIILAKLVVNGVFYLANR